MTNIHLSIDDLSGVSLVRYREWREDADAVIEAAQGWSSAPSRDRAIRFASYVAALDQEQGAAEAYSRSIERLEQCAGHLAAADLRHRSEAAEVATILAARSGASTKHRRLSK